MNNKYPDRSRSFFHATQGVAAPGPEDEIVQGNIAELIAQLTLEEKAALCSGRDFWHLKGIERLGIPAIAATDGPHGLRKQREGAGVMDSVPATCFPTASALANSWDRDLLFAVGAALGAECLQEQVAVLLGPGANIKRSPLCGRNFEYFSEDPCLSGDMAAALIEGIQSRGVGASLKHFAVNNQEQRRMTIDARVDERTLREIYLAGFERAIKKAKPWTVMCAYNRVNGDYCSEHERLLTRILRDEWGFEGVLLTDWGACNDRVAGLRAGQDLEMPGSGGVNDARIVAAVRAGELEVAVLDRAVGRVLSLILRSAKTARTDYRYDADAHHALARRAAAQSIVLLKNDAAMLPLMRAADVAVIGALATEPRYQGAGSSQINPTRLDNALDEIRGWAPDCRFAAGYSLHDDAVDAALLDEACALARDAAVVIVFAGLPAQYECEGFDRRHIELPHSHNALIEALARIDAPIVVVLANGAPVNMPWADSVQAIVECCLGGQAGAGAAVDVLFGAVNPSGKLAETYPLALADTPAFRYFPGGPDTVEYREALYVGYRYYETFGRAVRFPFGHGLSYTTFSYADIALSHARGADTEPLGVGIRVRNTGARAGAEIVQLYVRAPASAVFRPFKELRDFAKVELEPGAEKTLAFTLDRRAFAYFHAALGDWQVESGEFEILIGASSADIRARATVWIEAERAVPAAPDLRVCAPVYYAAAPAGGGSEAFEVADAAFQALHGPLPARAAGGAYSLNSCLGEIRRHWLGAQIYRAVLRATRARLGAANDPTLARMSEETTENMPLRLLVLFSDGRFSFAMAELLLAALNGRLLREIGRRLCAGLGLSAKR